MARLIDELITKFTLKDEYSKTASNIVDKTNSATRAINAFTVSMSGGAGLGATITRSLPIISRMGLAFLEMGTAVGLFLTTIPGMIALVVLATVAIGAMGAAIYASATAFGALQGAIAFLGPSLTQAFFLKVTMPLVKAAAEIDAFERIFSALLQDRAKGTQLVEFARSFGLKSAFEQEPILQTIKTLVAGGQDVNRFLPVLEAIGLFAGGKSEDLRQVSDIVKRIIGGQITEAMGPIGLGRFGINKSMLESIGAIFDAKGGFVGGVKDAFEVLENLVNSPAFSSIRELMEGSINVRLSNAMDALTLAMQDMGKAVATLVLPPLEKAADMIRFLAESGFLEKLVNTWATFLNMGSGDSALSNSVAIIADTFMELPNIISFAWNAFRVFILAMASAIDDTINMMLNIPFFGIPIFDFSLVEGLLKGGLDAGKGIANFVTSGIKSTADEIRRDFKNFDSTSDLVAPEIPALIEGSSAMVDTANNTAKIAEYTRAMLDIQRFAFGGGDVGRLGVTALERANLAAGGVGFAGNADKDINELATILQRMAKKQFWLGRTISKRTGV